MLKRIKINTEIKMVLINTLIILLVMIIVPAFNIKSENTYDLSSVSVDESSNIAKSENTSGNVILNCSNIVKIYITETGEIIEVPLEEYICSVVACEMPVNFELEALKAQAVAARTYLASKICNKCTQAQGADVCDSTHCQVYKSKENIMNKWEEDKAADYWNKIVEAVNSTAGQVLTYNGELILYPQYFSTSSGKTEDAVNVLSEDIPYLKSVDSNGEESAPKYSSVKEVPLNDFINIINANVSNSYLSTENIANEMKIVSKSDTGSIVELSICGQKVKGTEFRTMVGLNSTNFTCEISGDNIIFYCKGYGHGVGMSQWGANAMAKSGSSYDEILRHYYTGIGISNLQFNQ